MKRTLSAFILWGADITVLIGAYYGVGWLRMAIAWCGFPPFYLYPKEDLIILVGIIVGLLWYEKIYTYRFDFWEETRQILKALLFSFALVLGILMLSRLQLDYARSFIVLYFLAIAFLLPFSKRLVKKWLFKRHTVFRKRVKIIGNVEQSALLQQEFSKNWYLGMLTVAKGHEALFITTKDLSIEQLHKLLDHHIKMSKEIYLLPYASKINFANANTMEYFNIRTSVIHLHNKLLRPSNRLLKAVVETLMVLLAFPLFLLLHVWISWRIAKDSEGEVLFKQARLGQEGNSFTCYKYRTMYPDGERILQAYLEQHPEEIRHYETYHKYHNDPRITPFGQWLRRTSLDELPQLFNVLKGEMSLVGPRPYMCEEEEKLGTEAQTILHVKPGITGLWQVSGRNTLSFEERKERDLWYIQNWSLWMDFIILCKTIKVVLEKKGVS